MTPGAGPGEAPFEPATAGAAGTVFQCPLCGLRFTHAGQVCRSCPLRAGCDLVSCPGCSYAYPRTSRLVEWGRRLLGRGRRRGP